MSDTTNKTRHPPLVSHPFTPAVSRFAKCLQEMQYFGILRCSNHIPFYEIVCSPQGFGRLVEGSLPHGDISLMRVDGNTVRRDTV